MKYVLHKNLLFVFLPFLNVIKCEYNRDNVNKSIVHPAYNETKLDLNIYTISNHNKKFKKLNYLERNSVVCNFRNNSRCCTNRNILNIYVTRIKNKEINSSFVDTFFKINYVCDHIKNEFDSFDNKTVDDLIRVFNFHNFSINESNKSTSKTEFVKHFPFFNRFVDISCFNFISDTISANEGLNRVDNKSVILSSSDKVELESFNRRKNDKYIICFDLIGGEYRGTETKLNLVQIEDMYGRYFQDICYIKNVGVILYVSAFLMLLTVIVYIILPSLRTNVYGKCVVLYLITMIVSFASFATRLTFAGRLGSFCQLTGFVFQFAWVSSFTWQSVMCFDILLALSVLRWRVNIAKDGLVKKILFYSLYAYGLPAILTLTTVFLQFGPLIDDDSAWKPNIGGEYCFFQNSIHSAYKARWLYFCGPYSVIIVINVIMFIATAILIRKHSQPVNDFRDSNLNCTLSKREQELFKVHLNLFFVMGTNWILEVVSVIKDNAGVTTGWVFRMVDYFNAAIGAVLFIVLVCKFKVLRKLKAKLLGKSLDKRTSFASQQEDISITSTNHMKPGTSNGTNISLITNHSYIN